jgi:hypothetical protein
MISKAREYIDYWIENSVHARRSTELMALRRTSTSCSGGSFRERKAKA